MFSGSSKRKPRRMKIDWVGGLWRNPIACLRFFLVPFHKSAREKRCILMMLYKQKTLQVSKHSIPSPSLPGLILGWFHPDAQVMWEVSATCTEAAREPFVKAHVCQPALTAGNLEQKFARSCCRINSRWKAILGLLLGLKWNCFCYGRT